MMDSISAPPLPTRFRSLEQADFQRLEHAAYLKGLLKPFKGKGAMEVWASQCAALRDDVIALAQQQVLPQARGFPFNLLSVHLGHQTTGAGTTFLRWRNLDRSSMGTSLWEGLMADPATPTSLIGDLYAMELQRITMNLQVSLTHSMARNASDCAQKMAQAEAVYWQRATGHAVSRSPTPTKEIT